MNEATKATIQSIIRHAMQALAGVWVAKNPDLAGVTEAGIVSLVAILWTYIDNQKKANQPPPAVSISKTLGVLALIAGLSTGCASTPQEKVVRFAAVAQSVAFEGASLWLLEKPQHKDVLQGVVDQLDIAIEAKQFTPIRLVAILRPLNIREMSSKEGRIAIGATIIVWDGLRLSGAIGDTTNLEPVFAGIRDGFQSAINTTK